MSIKLLLDDLIIMSNKSEKVKIWRINFKRKIVESMGGGCCICGYNKCHSALALHHLDPSKKDFGLGKVRANPTNWSRIVDEIKKCILVCHNCHSELHEGIIKIPIIIPLFNEELITCNPKTKQKEFDNCPVCNKQKPIYRKNCSRSCSAKSSYKVDWDSINLIEELKIKSIVKIAEEIGCSDSAVRKRVRKLGLK